MAARFEDLDFLIVGAAKCATTWLQQALQADPAVRMPDPELHYFSREHARGSAWYLQRLPDKENAQLLGEKSNSYMDAPACAERIRTATPHVRLIAVLRDPVERAYSDYCMLYRRGEVDRDIRRHLDPGRAAEGRFIASGRYAERLEPFLRLFPRDRILVLLYESLKADPAGELARVRAFLELPARSPALVKTERVKDRTVPVVPPRMRRSLEPLKPIVRPLRGRRLFEQARGLVAREVTYPALDADLRAKLAAHYRPDTMRLISLVGCDPSKWSSAQA